MHWQLIGLPVLDVLEWLIGELMWHLFSLEWLFGKLGLLLNVHWWLLGFLRWLIWETYRGAGMTTLLPGWLQFVRWEVYFVLRDSYVLDSGMTTWCWDDYRWRAKEDFPVRRDDAHGVSGSLPGVAGWLAVFPDDSQDSMTGQVFTPRLPVTNWNSNCMIKTSPCSPDVKFRGKQDKQGGEG